MTRLRQVIDAAAVALAEAGVGSPRTDAELLAACAAGTDRGRLALADVGPEFCARYDGLVAQRAKRRAWTCWRRCKTPTKRFAPRPRRRWDNSAPRRA